MINFFVASSKEFMPRTQVCLDSIKKYHPNSKIYFENYEAPKTGHYLDGFAKFRINKLIDILNNDSTPIMMLGADCVLYGNIDFLSDYFIDYCEMSTDTSLILFPHVINPPKKDQGQLYLTGHANADLLLVGPSSFSILKWLSEQEMVAKPQSGIFYEQTYLSALPFLFYGIEIDRNPSFNYAYFNTHERNLSSRNGEYFVDNYKLCIAQFSGYEEGKPERMSKYNKYGDAFGATLELFKEYDEAIRRNKN